MAQVGVLPPCGAGGIAESLFYQALGYERSPSFASDIDNHSQLTI
jgi:hypothetical protein